MSDKTKAIEESAKAIQEVAKTGQEAIQATREVGGWLDRIFGKAIENTVGRFWTDRIAASRVAAAIYDWERLTTLLRNVEKRLQDKGIETTRTVPPKVALPLLEYATMEHEAELHALWESLLTAALDPSEEEIKRVYVSVLAELSGRDARELREMYAEWWYYERERPSPLREKGENRYSSGVGGEHEGSTILFYRLGLVLPVHIPVEEYRERSRVTESPYSRDDSPFYVEGGDKYEVLGDLSVVGFTEFGEKFCKVVIGDVTGLYKPPDWAAQPKANGVS